MTAAGTTLDAGAGSPDALRAYAAREVPDDPALGALAAAYYAGVPAEELVDDPRDALAAVRAHRSLARLRVPGRPVTAVLDTPASAATDGADGADGDGPGSDGPDRRAGGADRRTGSGDRRADHSTDRRAGRDTDRRA